MRQAAAVPLRNVLHEGVDRESTGPMRPRRTIVRRYRMTSQKEELMSATESAAGSGSTAVRPVEVAFSDEELSDLRRRINTTRWPERETVADDSQGVPLALMQELARYWGTDYDWRPCEAKLNALPQFITEIDGLDIHFIHVRSQHEDALPLIVTHGWPGSIIEQMKIIVCIRGDPSARSTRVRCEQDPSPSRSVSLKTRSPAATESLRRKRLQPCRHAPLDSSADR